MVEVSGLYFKYGDNEIFNNLNLKIERNSFVSIMGTNGVGKTTLFKILCGMLEFDGEIKIDDKLLTKSNLKNYRKSIGIVFNDIDSQFLSETVSDELAFNLENLEYPNIYIKNEINNISLLFGINNIINKKIEDLNKQEKIKLSIAAQLVHKPKVLLLDNVMDGMTSKDKEEIYQVLKKYKETERITIIQSIHDSELSVYGDRLIIINKGNVYLDGNVLEVFNEEKKLNRLGIRLPFCLELSNYLMLYDLIGKKYCDMDKLVNALWK